MHCKGPMDYSMKSFRSDGSRSTWIFDPTSAVYSKTVQYVNLTSDPDKCHEEVLANFLTAARQFFTNEKENHKHILSGNYLLSRQKKNGSWQNNHDSSPCYSSMMILTALKVFDVSGVQIDAATSFLEFNTRNRWKLEWR